MFHWDREQADYNDIEHDNQDHQETARRRRLRRFERCNFLDRLAHRPYSDNDKPILVGDQRHTYVNND